MPALLVGLRERRLERPRSVPLTCSVVAEGRGHARPPASRAARRASASAPSPSTRWRASAIDHLADGAVGEELAVGDVGERVAALGLVHVMRGHQHRDALVRRARGCCSQKSRRASGRRPRWARRAAAASARGSDTRRARGAASSRRRACPRAGPARASGRAVERAVDGRSRSVTVVHARDEVEVLAIDQVLLEAELLRHVADVALDRSAASRCRGRGTCPPPASGVSRPQIMRM